ncbi:MAG TPA: DUF2169 domain-containing protein [Sandaracinaceae bacterium LLY-WYZ-13_1]|nr:DUF2169 domain-containing protein [Sandaracinaceae bacterium LLY-WYZ-13_1]
MKLVADSPLRVGWLPWQFVPGDWRLVVAVKATVELPREGVATLAEEQAFVTGDMFWDDDPERSLRYAEDLALIKPRGEVWLTGTVHTSEPVRELSCLARVGDVQMRFSVVGDRWWRSDGGQTEPEPFTEMPLCWERCFGGPGFEANPVGRGIVPDPDDPEGRVALPNVERYGRLIRSPGERPEPAGAWPVPRTWPERMRHLGQEYGGSYLRERWPYFAEDFSWRYFQAARESQRIEGYWRGDEVVELGGLHPVHPRLRCQLPGIKPRVFLHERERSQGPLREVGLVLDTVAIDAGEGRAHLVWRGATPCAGEGLEELAHLYVTHEPLGQPQGAEAYFGAFVARLRALWEEEQGFEAEQPKAPEKSTSRQRGPEPPRVQQPPTAEPPSAEALLEARREEAREQGWPEALIASLYPDGLLDDGGRTRQETIDELKAGIGAAEELGLEPAVIEGLRGVLSRVEAETPAPEPAPSEVRAEPPPGLWTSQELRDEVQRRMAVGEPLRGLMLADADLSLLDLSGRDLSGSILVRANLQHATLDGARLDGVALDEAKLSGSSFRGASMVGANFDLAESSGVDFTGAVLDDARAERAMLDGAVFRSVKGRGLGLEECLLVGADFEGASLVEAVFDRSSLDESSFRGTCLADACFEAVSLRRACLDQIEGPGLRLFEGTDVSEATLRWATLVGASFANAICIGTKLTESDLTRASFAGARLEGAELLAVRARNASFAGAQMGAASLAGADLLGARFEGARLAVADLSGANLYGAELWKADLTDVRLDGANVEGTKIA